MTPTDPTDSRQEHSWRALLRGNDGMRLLVLCGGVALHAINLYLAATVMPSVVRQIGGIEYYAWSTSLFVVGSILGAALASHFMRRVGCRTAYLLAAAIFALGCVLCAASSTMPMFILGRCLQGAGGGLLLTFPYALIEQLFASTLWPHAMALISGMWGVATLLGPALGGVLAEFGLWRAAFATLAPIALLCAIVAFPLLPERTTAPSKDGLPIAQLMPLTAAVLVISAGSVMVSTVAKLMSLIASVALLCWLRHRENNAAIRLLPQGSLGRTRLRPLYLSMALLAVTVTCSEIFVPWFLQELHGLGPLAAGAIAATMSAGWTVGSIATSGANPLRVEALVQGSPWISALGLCAILIFLPIGSDGRWTHLVPIVAALSVVGFAVGIAWPHLATRVIRYAPPNESDLAAASIMTVQLIGTAFSASLAGIIMNVAGMSREGGGRTAALWLFGAVLLAPVWIAVTGTLRSSTTSVAQEGCDLSQ